MINGSRLTAVVDVDLETEKFRNHWVAKPGKDGNKRDWGAAWRNWMLNAVKFAPRVPQQSTTAATATHEDLEAAWKGL